MNGRVENMLPDGRPGRGIRTGVRQFTVDQALTGMQLPQPEGLPGRAISAAEPLASAGVEVTVDRWVRGSSQHTQDRVAEEVPVALLYNGEPHVVMLATPHDLEDLARGFSLSEELVDEPEEIRGIEVRRLPEAAEVRIAIAWDKFPELLRRRRNLTGRTGCGLCGSETLEQTVRTQSTVGAGPTVSVTQLHEAIAALPELQLLNAKTGSVHASAWVVPGRGIECLREDVGRHNALDKTLGALVLGRRGPRGGLHAGDQPRQL